MPEVVVKGGLEKVEFFGEIDKKIDPSTGEKKVTSDYPAWYFKPQIREIKDGISRIENALERGEIPEKGRPAALAELKMLKEKNDKIAVSVPDISDSEKDAISKVRKDLGKKIAETMFSRSDEMKGLPDAHDEYERQTKPCIKISGDEATIARKLGCRISRDGEVSRNDASRMWKVISRSLGEGSDTEILRRS